MVVSALRVRRAARAFQRVAADPGRAGRRRADHGAERHRAVEAGGAQPGAHHADRAAPSFLATWRDFARDHQATRRLVALGLGTVAFSMQDILLEPYGGHVLGLPVAATTAMTALLAVGGLIGFGIGARLLGRGADPYRLAGMRRAGRARRVQRADLRRPARPRRSCSRSASRGIGLGAGLFAHCTLTAAISSAAARPGRPRARHLGRGAGLGRRLRGGARRADPRRRRRPRRRRHARPDPRHPRDRLRRRLHDRDRPAVRHPRRRRPARRGSRRPDLLHAVSLAEAEVPR